jgi:hypothetical protein
MPDRLRTQGTPPPEAKDARFFRAALPLAGLVALGVGGFWWWITFHQMRTPMAQLRDGRRTIVVDEQGESGSFRSLPLPIREVLVEMLRTGQVPLATEVQSSAATDAELQEWTRAAGGSHLVLGVTYARAGLLEEAGREFEALVRENPESPLARQLLEQVQSRRVR